MFLFTTPTAPQAIAQGAAIATMPLQRPPPPPSRDDCSPPSPPPPTTPPSPPSRPPFASPSDTVLSVPFEQMSIEDQGQLLKHHIAFPYDRVPRDPSIAIEAGRGAVDQSMFDDSRYTSESGKEYNHDQHGPLSRHRPAQRPDLPHRNSSFTKRHASFDTPREVPLPYMPSRTHRIPFVNNASHGVPQANTISTDDDANTHVSALTLDSKADGAFPSYDRMSADDGPSSSDSLPSVSSSSSSSSRPSQLRSDSPMDTGSINPYFIEVSEPTAQFAPSSSALQYPQSQPQFQRGGAPPTPLYPFTRPLSSPDASRPVLPGVHSPTPVRPSAIPDRGSTASLPLPSHTPYHLLPTVSGDTIVEGQETGTEGPPLQVGPLLLPQYPSSPSSWRYRSPSAGSDLLQGRPISPPAVVRFIDRSYSTGSMTAVDMSQLPPPAPPVVLTPPPPPSNEERRPRAPHEPFLAHSPPPQDSYIAVETKPREYRLLVRLPGFRRDAITLSTRKRRILHIVADSWEPNGGHFERRISFGYDADLAQVRAEFDGEFLNVIVPRRMVPVTSWDLRG
ncbi:hypothetical protein AcW1_008833 [Taiwanofungus camphoratus]|nr:hypothetical protein AcW1_008833 [Antrodia cinnamomea]